MPFGMGPASWAYVPLYAYSCTSSPYSVWPRWDAGVEAGDVVMAGAVSVLSGIPGSSFS
jgi:hypothetical protein